MGDEEHEMNMHMDCYNCYIGMIMFLVLDGFIFFVMCGSVYVLAWLARPLRDWLGIRPGRMGDR